MVSQESEERDTAWAELQEIREAIDANPEEATVDEVRRVIAEARPIAGAWNDLILALQERAHEFMSADGEGGFVAVVHRMADEVDRLRQRVKAAESRAEHLASTLNSPHEECRAFTETVAHLSIVPPYGTEQARQMMKLQDKAREALANRSESPQDDNEWGSMDSAPRDGTPIVVRCPAKWCEYDEYHVVKFNPTAGGRWEVVTNNSPNSGVAFGVEPIEWTHIPSHQSPAEPRSGDDDQGVDEGQDHNMSPNRIRDVAREKNVTAMSKTLHKCADQIAYLQARQRVPDEVRRFPRDMMQQAYVSYRGTEMERVLRYWADQLDKAIQRHEGGSDE